MHKKVVEEVSKHFEQTIGEDGQEVKTGKVTRLCCNLS